MPGLAWAKLSGFSGAFYALNPIPYSLILLLVRRPGLDFRALVASPPDGDAMMGGGGENTKAVNMSCHAMPCHVHIMVASQVLSQKGPRMARLLRSPFSADRDAKKKICPSIWIMEQRVSSLSPLLCITSLCRCRSTSSSGGRIDTSLAIVAHPEYHPLVCVPMLWWSCLISRYFINWQRPTPTHRYGSHLKSRIMTCIWVNSSPYLDGAFILQREFNT